MKSEQANNFKQELEGVLRKYKVEVCESDQYDQNEDPCGTLTYFLVDGEHILICELDESL